MSLHPSPFFTNTCRRAMSCHHDVLGGDLATLAVGYPIGDGAGITGVVGETSVA